MTEMASLLMYIKDDCFVSFFPVNHQLLVEQYANTCAVRLSLAPCALTSDRNM